MKKNFTLLCCLLGLHLIAPAQDLLTISVDASQLQNPDCWLNAGVVADDEVYFHSGLCTSNSNFCVDSIRGFGSPVWEHVTGNWGMDDGVGVMDYKGNAVWEITIDLETYHGAPAGATPYSMGFVFRNNDGTIEGKDNQCGDIFVTNLNSSNPTVFQGTTNAPMPGVTANKVTVGVQEARVLSGLKLFPNPTTGAFALRYQLQTSVRDFSATAYNQLGQPVAELKAGVQSPGRHTLNWDLPAAGLYQVVLRDGDQILAWEKVVVQ